MNSACTIKYFDFLSYNELPVFGRVLPGLLVQELITSLVDVEVDHGDNISIFYIPFWQFAKSLNSREFYILSQLAHMTD